MPYCRPTAPDRQRKGVKADEGRPQLLDWPQGWVGARKGVRLAAVGDGRVEQAAGQFPEPKWPETTLEQLLEIAFKGRVIDTMDHPVLRRLRGEI
jgi:hypothetical protein